mgnify:CR=1 FL=1
MTDLPLHRSLARAAVLAPACGIPSALGLWAAHQGGPPPLELAEGDGGDGRELGAEIGIVILAEAHVERAGAGEAHAIAGFAEIVGHGRDEADAPAGLITDPRHLRVTIGTAEENDRFLAALAASVRE